MALDYIIVLMTNPVSWLIQIVIIAISTMACRSVCPDIVSEIGIRRILLGYVAGLFGLVVYSLWISIDSINLRISKGYLDAASFYEGLPGSTLYTFLLLEFVAILMLAVLGLPVLLFLYHRKRASIAAFAGAAVVAGLLIHGLFFAITSKNYWQRANIYEYYLTSLADIILAFVIVAVAFSAGVGLPVLWGRRTHNV